MALIKNVLAMNHIPEDRVVILPSGANVTMPKIYKNSDLGLFPNRCEGGTNLVLMEYMACGKPIVATRTDGFEVLEENLAGLLVSPEDQHEFADALNRLISNPQLRRKMGENGRRHIIENRSWESVAREVFEVCQMVVRKHLAESSASQQ